MGLETSDDAAVYQITDEIAMIQTVDFFTPVVDDPYTFGQIAAANSLSDVYAMGGVPKIALNIAAFPSCLDIEILGEILRGGADKVKEAGAVLVGGHTIQDNEPKYGLCVSGFVHPKKIWKNYGCREGDVLILTKPIGSGVINTAVKAEMASKEAAEDAIRVMASLNKNAKEVFEQYDISACTDVTGFGLLGHCAEMASASDVTLVLYPKQIAWIKEAKSYANMGLVPAGAYRNREHTEAMVDAGTTEEAFLDLMYDPQTSGGLLASVLPEDADSIVKELKARNPEIEVSVIGTVKARSEKWIRLL